MDVPQLEPLALVVTVHYHGRMKTQRKTWTLTNLTTKGERTVTGTADIGDVIRHFDLRGATLSCTGAHRWTVQIARERFLLTRR